MALAYQEQRLHIWNSQSTTQRTNKNNLEVGEGNRSSEQSKEDRVKGREWKGRRNEKDGKEVERKQRGMEEKKLGKVR